MGCRRCQQSLTVLTPIAAGAGTPPSAARCPLLRIRRRVGPKNRAQGREVTGLRPGEPVVEPAVNPLEFFSPLVRVYAGAHGHRMIFQSRYEPR
jgi:hypothetical protein